MNSYYLKELADRCGITKELHSTVPGIPLPTTVTLTKGVPIETVSKMLGQEPEDNTAFCEDCG